jgi:hypothetical protein
VRLGGLDQAAGAGDELGDARRRAGEDKADDALGAAGHVVDCEPSAPRLAEEVAAVEPERGAHLVDLGHKPVDGPERRVVGRVRPAAPELVVDDRRSVLREPFCQRQHVVVRRARPAVQEEHRQRVAVSKAPIPHVAALDLDHAVVRHRIPSGPVSAGIMPGIPRPGERPVHSPEGWSALGRS